MSGPGGLWNQAPLLRANRMLSTPHLVPLRSGSTHTPLSESSILLVSHPALPCLALSSWFLLVPEIQVWTLTEWQGFLAFVYFLTWMAPGLGGWGAGRFVWSGWGCQVPPGCVSPQKAVLSPGSCSCPQELGGPCGSGAWSPLTLGLTVFAMRSSSLCLSPGGALQHLSSVYQ